MVYEEGLRTSFSATDNSENNYIHGLWQLNYISKKMLVLTRMTSYEIKTDTAFNIVNRFNLKVCQLIVWYKSSILHLLVILRNTWQSSNLHQKQMKENIQTHSFRRWW